MAGGFFDIAAGWIKQIKDRVDAAGQSGSDSRAGSGEAWQMTLQLEPGKTAETSGEPTDDPTVEPAWKENAEAVRTTVKWFVAAFALVGALMFAKGFVTTPKLSWDENRPQLLLALGLGMLGLIGVGCFLYTAVRMLRPMVYEISDIDSKIPKFIELVEKTGSRHFPEGINTFDDFRKQFERAHHSLYSSQENVDAAKAKLRKAKHADPRDPDDIKKKKEELEWWQDFHIAARQNHDAMETVRARLLNEAQYWSIDTAFDHKGIILVVAALVAAVSGIGYQLALAAPDEPKTSTTAPTVGELIRSDSASGSELWEQLGLSRCQPNADATRITVVVSSGDGSSQNPYVVSTIPTNACPGQTFTVIDAVARVSIPIKREIIYTPDSATSPSTADTPR